MEKPEPLVTLSSKVQRIESGGSLNTILGLRTSARTDVHNLVMECVHARKGMGFITTFSER